MGIAHISIDGWIQHLPFVGGQRPSAYGPVDGIWYGLVAGDGDASGGNVTLNGSLSFDRKEDWVYILGAITASKNGSGEGEVFLQANSGPLIPTDAVATTVRNPSFSTGGQMLAIANNSVSLATSLTGGAFPFAGMPIFGDKRITGTFLMNAAGFEINTDGATYQMSSWGFLIKYESFFRNVRPSVG